MLERIKYSLKAQHPSWKKDKIESSAYAIAVSRWKEKYGSSPFKK